MASIPCVTQGSGWPSGFLAASFYQGSKWKSSDNKYSGKPNALTSPQFGISSFIIVRTAGGGGMVLLQRTKLLLQTREVIELVQAIEVTQFPENGLDLVTCVLSCTTNIYLAASI